VGPQQAITRKYHSSIISSALTYGGPHLSLTGKDEDMEWGGISTRVGRIQIVLNILPPNGRNSRAGRSLVPAMRLTDSIEISHVLRWQRYILSLIKLAPPRFMSTTCFEGICSFLRRAASDTTNKLSLQTSYRDFQTTESTWIRKIEAIRVVAGCVQLAIGS